MKIYYIYILSNKPRGTLYIGVTNDLYRRMNEHRNRLIEGFTKQYELKKLVYVQGCTYIYNALGREKQLKRWHRDWKINLIEEQNPSWADLYEKYFGDGPSNTLKEIEMDPETSSG